MLPLVGSHPTDQTMPAHGWARVQEWELIETARTANQVIIRMALSRDELHATCELAFGQSLQSMLRSRIMARLANLLKSHCILTFASTPSMMSRLSV